MTIRVVVVDDSLFMRKLITNLLQEDPEIVVVGAARDGAEAVQLVERHRPDVVTMDVEMPRVGGLEAVRRIMSGTPVPIVMLSSLTEAGARVTVEALSLGAVDFIQKPSGAVTTQLHKVRNELLEKVRMAAKVPMATRRTPPKIALQPKAQSTLASQLGRTTSSSFQLVAVGTSTGGPSALNQLIPCLDANLPIAVLVVQHMPALFTRSLAERLNASSPMRVSEAMDGEPIESGRVYIAPGSHHMLVTQTGNSLRIRLEQSPLRNGHRPSVDVMFESVAALRDVRKHYVLMTGMGADGAQGMLLGKQSGAVSTLAESSETCVVYGMPKAAVELKCVDYVLPLPNISVKLAELVGREGV